MSTWIELDVYAEFRNDDGVWISAELNQDGEPKSLWGERLERKALNTFFGFGEVCGIQRIDKLRGLPDDLSPQLDRYFHKRHDECYVDDFTWFTLAELRQCDLSEFIIHSGYVSTELAPFFEDGLVPYPQHKIRNGVPSPKSKPTTTQFHGRYEVKVSWMETYEEMFGDFFDTVLPKLEKFGSDNCVRAILVFSVS